MQRKAFGVGLRLSASFIFLVSNNQGYASGFQIYEMATPSTATADVGQAAYANDASTAFLNPAGMTNLDDSQLLVGAQLFFPTVTFRSNLNNTISGGNGEKNDILTPGGGVYYVGKLNAISEKLRIGVSLASPYGGIVDYGDAWAGRYLVQKAEVLTLNINPAISYQLNELFAFGAGVAAQYLSLHESIALPLPTFLDGQISLKVADLSPGFNLGVLITPFAHTRIGVAYRSQINHKLAGNTYFNKLTAIPNTSTQINTPNSVIGSIYQDLDEQVSLVGEVGWTNWQKFVNTVVQISGFTSTVPRNWNNAFRFGVGGKMKVTPKIALMSGVSYDGSPIRLANRLPDFPLDRQVRIGVGSLYTSNAMTQFGFQYEFVDYGNARMHQATKPGMYAGALQKNYGQFISFTVNAQL